MDVLLKQNSIVYMSVLPYDSMYAKAHALMHGLPFVHMYIGLLIIGSDTQEIKSTTMIKPTATVFQRGVFLTQTHPN